MTARTPHRIANTQAQPVHLPRTRPMVDLLPRRYGVVLIQGSNEDAFPGDAVVPDDYPAYGEGFYGSGYYGE
jgi:hypothetical protein